MLYSYKTFIVSDAEYQRTRIGDLFRAGELVEGFGGLGDEVLFVVGYEHEEEDLVKQVPPGWCITFSYGMVVAAHPEHPPKTISFAEATDTLFQYWPEVSLE